MIDHHVRSVSIQNSDTEQEINENSPLLHDTIRQSTYRATDALFLLFLLLILVVGTTIGAYLLFSEDEEWRTEGIYNLISRQAWKAHPPSSAGMVDLKLPISQVLFYQTNTTDSCTQETQCGELIAGLQLKHMVEWNEPDIAFNFLFTGNGLIFEGRNWTYQTSFPYFTHANVLSLAFLGKCDVDSRPTLEQVESAKLLLDVAVMEGKLEPCYNILVWGENRPFIDLASNIQETRSYCEGTT